MILSDSGVQARLCIVMLVTIPVFPIFPLVSLIHMCRNQSLESV